MKKLLLFAALLVGLVSCQQNNPSPATTYDVEYTFAGGDCFVEYINETGSFSSLSSVNGTWSYSCQKESGDIIYLHAHTNLGETGSFTIRVYLDGVLYKEASGSGSSGTAAIHETLE